MAISNDQNNSKHKLNPSLLLDDQAKTISLKSIDLRANTTNISKMMTLRRRTKGLQQNEDKDGSTGLTFEQKIILVPHKPIYLTNREQLADNDGEEATSILSPEQQQQQHSQQQQQQQTKTEQIFSITQFATTTILLVGLLSYIVILGLFSLNMKSPAMLVNAQYSIDSTTSSNGDNFNRRSSSPPPSSSTTTTTRSNTVAPMQHQHQQLVGGYKPSIGSTLSSIDRYDSGGEQIRAPLLPKTTALPTMRMQIAASKSHDSYMSPEERDQLLRNQEKHYEGNSHMDPRTNFDPRSSVAGQNEGQELGSGATGGSTNGPMAGSSSNYKPASQTPEANDNEESDDDEDGPDEGPGISPSSSVNDQSSYQRAAAVNSQVPESRHGAMHGGSLEDQGGEHGRHPLDYNRGPAFAGENPYSSVATMATNQEEASDPVGDEYGAGAGNDDEYFSRKPGNLKLAASNNHNNNNNNRNYLADREQDRALGNILYNSSPSHYKGLQEGSNGRDSEESQGFGPGPNEAYLAEKAEAAAASRALDGPPSGGEGPDADVDHPGESAALDDSSPMDSPPPIDRRSNEQQELDDDDRNQLAEGNRFARGDNDGPPPLGDSSQMTGGRESGGSVDNQDPEDTGDSESNDSFASSSHPDPSNPAAGYNNNNNNEPRNPVQTITTPSLMVPRTSASAPAPLSALRPILGSNQKSRSKIIALTRSPVDPLEAIKLKQQAASQWQQERLINNPHLLSTQKLDQFSNKMSPSGDKSTIMLDRQTLASRPAQAVPYNPQNNPSHAGKYFIN